MELPGDFIRYMEGFMGESLWKELREGLMEEPPASIRMNPFKAQDMTVNEGAPVPWCQGGWYLPTREQYEALGLWGAPALRAPDYWINGAGGTNETGFSALPAGFYDGTRKRFVNLLGETRFWSANPHDFSENPHYHFLNFFCGEMQSAQANTPDAYSIRCILAE